MTSTVVEASWCVLYQTSQLSRFHRDTHGFSALISPYTTPFSPYTIPFPLYTNLFLRILSVYLKSHGFGLRQVESSSVHMKQVPCILIGAHLNRPEKQAGK